MTTQMESAKRGILTDEMLFAAKADGIPESLVISGVKSGRIVILKNNVHENCNPLAVGEGTKVKINSNIGSSKDICLIEEEIEKAVLSQKYGADCLMDLSTGGNLKEIRKAIMSSITIPIGTVPIYEVGFRMREQKKSLLDFDSDIFFKVIEDQLKEGVDFITVHAGITKEIIDKYDSSKRLTGIVSRGGGITAKWIQMHQEENPLNENFDYLLELAHEFDATLSLGDGLRPGSLNDASDFFQFAELKELGRLVKRSREANVMSMVEGPGHLPISEIERNMKLQKEYCDGAPFYVLGPLVTDIAMGYDHISGAIGGTIAAMAGADLLCYLTPAEHLALPNPQDVVEGVIAFKIAAHSVNLMRFKDEMERNNVVSKARANFDWNTMFSNALHPERAREIHDSRLSETENACSMCGEFCPMRLELGSRKAKEIHEKAKTLQ